ncbi:hypothetical protein VTK56DRAFT_3669 [Thermocarpiscus australiensis]
MGYMHWPRSGGIATSILTAPLDVLRTRLQSDFYRKPSRPGLAAEYAGSSLARLLGAPFRHMAETFGILGSIKANEGWRGLFRGLGPSIAGVAPATAVKFYVYGNCKRLGASILGRGEDDSLVHAQAAILAGVATATATNLIWLVKTRLQLDKSQAEGGAARQYRSTSYLGTVETALHLVLYEQLKSLFQKPLLFKNGGNPVLDELATWASTSGAAGTAKLVAALLTYPHECFRSVWAQEGWRGLYGGLTPHLVRSIPSAVITLGVHEFVLRMAGTWMPDRLSN